MGKGKARESTQEILKPSTQKPDVKSENPEGGEEVEEEYDEEEDEDYDPEAKIQDEKEVSEGEESSDNEAQPDYSAIENAAAQERLIKTRSQRHQEKLESKPGFSHLRPGLVTSSDINQRIDVDAIFSDLKQKSDGRATDDWKAAIGDDKLDANERLSGDGGNVSNEVQPDNKEEDLFGLQKIKIESSYTFAGKVITESKLVDANSAEAKAYLNSTKGLTATDLSSKPIRSFVPVIRTIPGSSEPIELRIKLKRPSLIDKFLSTYGNKKLKLSTLEKSRLDWASFVDKKSLQDELTIHNKAGFLDKQEFLGRLQDKRDELYQKAKEDDRKRQWQLQQQQL